jgi:hypothetical protein
MRGDAVQAMADGVQAILHDVKTRAVLQFGPLVLSTATAHRPVDYVPSASAAWLCGKRLDWIEVVGP